MKKRLLVLLGALCCLGYYSCTKSTIKESEPVETEELSARGSHHGIDSTIFDPTHLVAPHAHLKELGSGFSFTEGPATDKHGNVFFTDQPNDKIYKWSAHNGAITTFLTGTGRSNGMYFDENGYLITCADMHGEVWSIDRHGNHKVLVDNYKGKLLNGPNDVWINPRSGGMYITDPLFGRDYWDASDPRKVNYWPGTSQQADPIGSTLGGYVYYLSPNRKKLTRVTTEAMGWSPDKWVNGIIGSPDGKKLYVNKWDFNTDVSKTFVFDIRYDGTLTNMKVFTDMGGDGMTMDERGNVYIANNRGVTAFDKKGNKVFNIPIPPGGSNNITFGGKDGKILFITGQNKVFGLRMRVKGAAQDHDNGHGHHH
jgi:gluconolactonase